VACEGCLCHHAREGEHGEAPILELGGLLAAELDGVRRLEGFAPVEVARLAISTIHGVGDGRDAGERLEERDEKQDLSQSTAGHEPVVCLPP